MNVLHLESGINWGGQEYRTLEEIQWLNRNGHHGALVCLPESAIAREARKMNVPFFEIPLRNNLDVVALWKIWRISRREKIDVLHTHGSKDSWICFPFYLFGCPVVRSRHITLGKKNSFGRAFIFRFGCSRVIATAKSIADDFVQRFKVPREKIDVVGEGIDLARFNPDNDGLKFREQLQVDPKAILVGMVGMIRREKGQLQFISAALRLWKKFGDVRFVLVGAATESFRALEAECRRQIQEAGAAESIRMPGYISDVPGALAAMDIVVVPSLAEAQSRVVPEAFAMRKAVVASNVGGLPELVQNEHTGLLVPRNDPEALAAAIERLIADSDLRAKLASEGFRKACENLSIERMMQETLAVYRKAGVKE